MRRGLVWYLVGSAALLALAGCGRGIMQFTERETWRKDAEVACLKSGAVKITPMKAQSDPINGPGMCGADFPLKVAALGDAPSLGYAEAPRPPGSVGSARVSEQQLAPQMRWMTGPAPAQSSGEPMQIAPPQTTPSYEAPPPRSYGAPARTYDAPRYEAPASIPARRAPPQDFDDEDDIPDDAEMPQQRGRSAPATRPAYEAPRAQPQHQPPAQGPSLGRRSQYTGSIGPAAVTPAATLACPVVAALDNWVSTAVQPAAMKWFGQPVVEIKQISAYSCRGMNGNIHARISEHAFGNALDIAAFILADGRKVTVKASWKGAPEEQGFLRDVQGAACQSFTTVLAPGSNVYHYDHIHVDLMRRASGRRICQPAAVDGEVVARAAERSRMARGRGDPLTTSSIGAKPGKQKAAVPGEDGDFEEDE